MSTMSKQDDHRQQYQGDENNDDSSYRHVRPRDRRRRRRREHRPVHWWRPKMANPSSSASSMSSQLLPSFIDIQIKTHQALYNGKPPYSPCMVTTATTTSFVEDKSPKGSVDYHIQPLVDLINQHSHYCTLSSCSGRLSLFDPSGLSKGSGRTSETENPVGDGVPPIDGDEDATTTSPDDVVATNGNIQQHDNSRKDVGGDAGDSGVGGKGVGRWVLVSHDYVEPQELIDSLSSSSMSSTTTSNSNSTTSTNPWILKFEPMLLHVAASSLSHGQQLLRLALDLGFRESGLVVTDRRVTVAIRCHSLALSVPIFFYQFGNGKNLNENNGTSSSLSSLLSNDYLISLVLECNRRLESNWDQMERLYDSIATNLFELRNDCIRIRSLLSLSPSPSTIPSLNLWNASAAAVDCHRNEQDKQHQSIWVLGGYGKGPDNVVSSSSSSSSSSSKRSEHLYCLTRNWMGDQYSPWDTNWRLFDETNCDNKTQDDEQVDGIISLQEGMLSVEWQFDHRDLQSMSCCRLQPSGLVVFWGGRQGPTRPSPSSVLYILDQKQQRQQPRLAKVVMATPKEEQQQQPRPRWGHSLISISHDRAVLVGGCDEPNGAMDDVWILHLRCATSGYSTSRYFEWEKLDVSLPTPRFHFGAVALQNDCILILGGLLSTKSILDPFDDTSNNQTSSDSNVWGFQIGYTSLDQDTDVGTSMIPETNAQILNIHWKLTGTAKAPVFGFGMSCCTLMSGHLLVVTGGISCTDQDDDPIQAYWITSHHDRGPYQSQTATIQLERIPVELDTDDDDLDFGSLVHHCCIPVVDDESEGDSDDTSNMNNREIVLVGGGVTSFAFGETFSKSHHLRIDVAGREFSSYSSATALSHVNPQNVSSEEKKFTKPKAKVVYVNPSDAKRVKIVLESNKWLDKRFRMMKVSQSDCLKSDTNPGGSSDADADATAPVPPRIALPIAVSFDVLKSSDAMAQDVILGYGEEDLPWSSSQIASEKNKRSM
jgi:tRNA wybutosine-synthesizing protein 3